MNCRVCVVRDKKNILDCLEDPSINAKMTLNPSLTRLHVVTMATISHQVCVIQNKIARIKTCWLRFGIPARPSLIMRFILLKIVVRRDSEPIPKFLFDLRI